MVRPSASTDVFRALADPTRRAMLDLLRESDLPVLELAADFDMSLPAVSQHLKVLREAGLVTEERDGRQRVYSLQAAPLQEAADWLSHYEGFWNSRLKKLAKHLRDQP